MLFHRKAKKTDDPAAPIQQKFVAPYVDQLRDLAGLPNAHFSVFYEQPISRLVGLARHCCSKKAIESHLTAIVSALKRRRPLILPPDADSESINAQKDVWTYAVFVGASMYRLESLLANKVIIKSGRSHSSADRWSPFDTEPPRAGDTLVENDVAITPYANLTFLTLIFCRRCLAWLYRDTRVFNTALELAVFPDAETPLGQLILQSHHRNKRTHEPTPCASPVAHESQNQPEQADKNSLEPPQASQEATTDHAELSKDNFLRWLRHSIASGNYVSYMCEIVNGHALADPDIFQGYAKVAGHPEWKRLRHELLKKIHYRRLPYKVSFNNNTKRDAIIVSDIDTLAP